MKRFALKAAAAVLFSCSAIAAHAGYAQLAPPAGWATSPGASATFTVGNAANASTLANGTVRTSAALNVAGRTVSIPASMRFAANAPRIAAGVLFGSPQLRVLIGLGTMLAAVKYGWDADTQSWREKSIEGSPGYYWSNPQLLPIQYSSPSEVCKAMHGQVDYIVAQLVDANTANCFSTVHNQAFSQANRYSTGSNSCPAGWTQTPAGCLGPAIQKPQFVEEVGASRMPDSVPLEIPNTPLPVEMPEIAPTFIPTGNPYPNPNYNPDAAPSPSNQPFLQPGVRVSPAPTPESPWQVDVQPITRPVTDPTPNPNPISDPLPNPNDQPDRDREDDTPPTDTPLGDIPELYKKKYPEGISGVVTLKIEQLRATPLFRLPSLLMPNLPDSGTCPSWQVNLSLAGWANMGTHTVQAPCMVWDFGKVVIIVSALLLARRLIFGG